MPEPITFGDLNVTVSPLTTWPADKPATVGRRASSFRSTWDDTLDLLRTELRHLAPERVVLYLDVPPGKIRTDGLPRADAVPSSPRVILNIETEPTVWLRFPCDTFDDWKDNVRAIALSLKALRDMERWGVMRGEQYEGMKMLPARVLATSDGIHSPQMAAEFIAAEGTGKETPDPKLVRSILTSPDVRATYYTKAARRLHPEAGGDAARFHRLQAAKRVLELNADLVEES